MKCIRDVDFSYISKYISYTLRRVVRKYKISCPLTGASTDCSVFLFFIFFFIRSSMCYWFNVKREQVYCWRCILFGFWKFLVSPRSVEKNKNGHLSRPQLTDTRVYNLQTTLLWVYKKNLNIFERENCILGRQGCRERFLTGPVSFFQLSFQLGWFVFFDRRFN